VVAYANGGESRKYYGNDQYVINWSDEAKLYYDSHGGLSNSKFWNKLGITWSLIAKSKFHFVLNQNISNTVRDHLLFCEDLNQTYVTLAFLNSTVGQYYLSAISPTINTTVNDVLSLPVPELDRMHSDKSFH
jgi:hypothetical protein